MPFTFSHAAAVVPLARWVRLPLSALVVGSLSPDLIYFMQLKASGNIGHTLPGLFVFCLPVGLAALWLWHEVAKLAAVALLPPWVRARTLHVAHQPFRFGPGRRLVQVAAAILLGALTHIAWDAFTHVDGWVAERVPLFQQLLPFPGFGSMPVYKLAQLLSTAVGAALLAWWARQWLGQQPAHSIAVPKLRHRRAWLAGLVLAAAAAGVLYARSHAAPLMAYPELRVFTLRIIITTCTAFWLGLLAFAGWYRWRYQPHLGHPVPAPTSGPAPKRPRHSAPK
ncbi:DUF4184 family protein [Hymenobacter latericus]|uniref:DUF4184 family protein n=1 Tax=Hymenobacter sp. YIM 151858-1 TaxID=2987688 RepID=UPI0022277197|nr:DUF4184 family protein [Hymenobacter sp. YIM 151858-1]UYZ59926.1 DUF4184 family protein [Hymenobacter sp. YIM 151858-1]